LHCKTKFGSKPLKEQTKKFGETQNKAKLFPVSQIKNKR